MRKKPVYKYIPDYLEAWYNIEKGNNHRKKREKNSKMKLKKFLKKEQQVLQDRICALFGTAVSRSNA